MMEAFKKLAVGPDELPDIIFASIGRTIWKVRTAAAAHVRQRLRMQPASATHSHWQAATSTWLATEDRALNTATTAAVA
jgi:hypothetical protein